MEELFVLGSSIPVKDKLDILYKLSNCFFAEVVRYKLLFKIPFLILT